MCRNVPSPCISWTWMLSKNPRLIVVNPLGEATANFQTSAFSNGCALTFIYIYFWIIIFYVKFIQ
jgi:hypothetical protein